MDLTTDQQQAIEQGDAVPVTIDQTECVVVRRDVYERMKALYDDSGWTEEALSITTARTFEDADKAGPIE